MLHKITPLFPHIFPVAPVDKPVDNVDKSRYVNSYKRLRIKLCKLILKEKIPPHRLVRGNKLSITLQEKRFSG